MRSAQVPRAGEVDPDHPVPVGRVVAEDAADDVHRRVVDQDLHRAQRGGDGVHDRVDLVPVAGVQRVAGHGGRRVVGGDRRGHLLGAARVDVGHHHARAAGGQPPRHRLPDALTRGRRHQRDPAAELIRIALLFSTFLPGQAEHRLGEDVALHLGGAGVDRAGPGVQEGAEPGAGGVGGAGVVGAHRAQRAAAFRHQPVQATDVQGQFGRGHVVLAPVQFRDRGRRAERSVPSVGSAPG